MDEHLLTIGAFARRSRLSLKALRLYERLGLLSPAAVDPDNGYRHYREAQLFTARLIVGLRRLDMPLSDVARVVAASGDDRAQVLAAYWVAVERRVAAQRVLAERLLESLHDDEPRHAAFEVAQRDVPDALVVSETQTVDLTALRAAITGAVTRLTRSAAEHGGAIGGPVVIFHGAVNEDSDGPVEVCLAVRSASDATRIEPAHHEAYVTVTKAEWDWPQVLSVYDAIEEWIRRNGRTIAGSPREIYRAGFEPGSVRPTHAVCEIAFPVD